MKKLWISIFLVLSLGTACMAADKVETPVECKQCGMKLSMYGHSKMVVTYEDGSSANTCSLNCVVTDMKTSKSKTTAYKVADYNTKKMTDAKKATWVIGGNKKGVMTKIPKWAFADKKDADSFIKTNGGKLATFDDALNAAEEENIDKNQHKEHMH